MTCCGKILETRFCPDCGSENTSASALASLLKYLTLNAKVNRSKCEEWRTGIEKETGANRDRFQRAVDKRNRTAQKWERWRDELLKLLDKAEMR